MSNGDKKNEKNIPHFYYNHTNHFINCIIPHTFSQQSTIILHKSVPMEHKT